MEVDEIEPSRKLQRLSNGAEMSTNTRIRDWNPSSRIIRVSRASGGKDRHSKVLTSKGLRDRRIRLSVSTAIQFYDLQDRLGLDQPSKAVEWLINAASDSISDLPSINPNFSETSNNNGGFGDFNNNDEIRDFNNDFNNNFDNNQNQTVSLSKSGGSSTSETSKSSSAAALSLSRTEIRGKARERARERTAKEKEKDAIQNTQQSSFTQLLTGGFHQTGSGGSGGSSQTGLTRQWNGTGTDYFNPVLPHIPQFTISSDQNRQDQTQQMNNQFSFAPDLTPAADYNTLNFGISSSSCSSRSAIGGYNRGTLQSNSSSFLFNNNIHQRSSSSSSSSPMDSQSISFFMAAPPPLDHHSQNLQAGCDGRLFLYGNRSSENKGKERR